MAIDPNVQDAERHDDPRHPISMRLDGALLLVQRSNARTAAIAAGWAAPPEPDRPAIVAALKALLGEAEVARATAQRLLSLVARP